MLPGDQVEEADRVGIRRGIPSVRFALFRKGSILFFFFFWLPFVQAFPQGITPDTVRAWLQAEPIAAPYRELTSSLVQVFETASTEGLPVELLFDKLKEGVAKKVPPTRLRSVLEGEVGRLLKVRQILQDGFGTDVARGPLFLQAMKIGSLALLSGFPEEGLQVVCSSGADIEKMVSMVPLLVEMHRVAALPVPSLAHFVQALSGSTIPSAQYGTFVSLYLKAIAGRIPPADTLRIMGDVLKAGGGILQIERELARRMKK